MLGLIGTVFSIIENNNILFTIISISLLSIGFVIIIFIFLKEMIKPSFILKCNKFGIVDVYSNSNESRKIENKIKNAKTIDLFFQTGQAFFNKFQSAIVHTIKENNTKIRIIVGKKDSVFLKDISNIEIKFKNRSENRELNNEINAIEEFVHDFKARTHKDASIGLKHFSTEFRTSMILIKTLKDEWGWVTLTTPPLKTADSISFEIINNSNKDNIYKQCKKHFDSVWEMLD